MEKYDWKTAKGARVEIEVSQEHTEIVDADGDKVEVTKKGVRLEGLKMNGKEYTGRISGRKVIFEIKGRQAAAIIPDEIYQAIMAQTFARWDAESEASADYDKSHNAITRAMSY